MALGFKRRAWKRSCNHEITRDKLLFLSNEAKTKLFSNVLNIFRRIGQIFTRRFGAAKNGEILQKQMPQKVKSK